MSDGEGHYKDAILDGLRQRCNVAQYISFDASLAQRFALIRGHTPNQLFVSAREGVSALLSQSPEGTVNVRSFHPAAARGRDFLYGLGSVDDVLDAVRRLAAEGLYTIVNETVDVNDGGVSGVAHGDLIEFAPGDTPRCVERAGTTQVSRLFGQRLLERVYGFAPEIPFPFGVRVEFSVHPIRRGFQKRSTIIWEVEETASPAKSGGFPRWPSRFSQHLGDKAFGLLVADLLGLRVPATTVFARALPPFRFGRETGTCESWLRTCPTEQVPGKYTTRRGWVDPFWLLEREDPEGTALASVLAQEGVDAEFSGALLTLATGEPVIEGVRGLGERFMLGELAPQELPDRVRAAVRKVFDRARRKLGPLRFEWVFDGEQIWVVQLHRERSGVSADEICAGTPSRYRHFDATRGLAELRREVSEAARRGEGIILVGDVGLSSHLCDVLRKAGLPSRLEREVSPLQHA